MVSILIDLSDGQYATGPWSPEQVGTAFDLSPGALSPLEPLRDYVTIVSNTDVRNAEAFSLPEIGADHFRSSAVFLTQSHPKQTQGSDIWAGTSFDQFYALMVCERPDLAREHVHPGVHHEIHARRASDALDLADVCGPLLGAVGGEELLELIEGEHDALVRGDNLRDWMNRMAARPHAVGSAYGKENAERMAGKTRLRYASLMKRIFSRGRWTTRSPPVWARSAPARKYERALARA